jgi:hypothetical protein
VTLVVIDASAGVEIVCDTRRGRALARLLPVEAEGWVPEHAGDAPVVHQDDVAAVQALLERTGGRGFALGALAPGVDISWFAGQRRHE